MWRFGLLVALVVGAIFLSPVERGEAGLGACILTTQDADIDILSFNYLYAALAACTGEDFDKAHISVHYEYYDWGEESWRYLRDLASASEENDDDILAWGAETVGAFLGINCRRINALFAFTHSGRDYLFDRRSNGECY